MSDDARNEMAERFASHRPDADDEAEGPSGEGSEEKEDTSHTDKTNETAVSSGTDEADDSSDTDATNAAADSVRNRKQYAMYLPESLRDRLQSRYDQFNAQRILDGQEKIEKNRGFHEAFVQAALDEVDNETIEEYLD